jgi:hypothetical protein
MSVLYRKEREVGGSGVLYAGNWRSGECDTARTEVNRGHLTTFPFG